MDYPKNQYVFFYPDWDVDKIFPIKSKETTHQIVNVLRCKSKDFLLLLNGKGQKLLVSIAYYDKNSIYCEPIELTHCPASQTLLHLIVGTPKKEALKDILKYGTQLGMSSLTLVDMSWSQIKNEQYHSKHDYWQKIIQESLEQSMGGYLPELEYLSSLSKLPSLEKIFIAEISSKENTLPPLSQVLLPKDENIYFLIGPEGGISQKDYEIIQKNQNTIKFSLSPHILRVETAAISSLVAAQTILASQTPR